MFLLFKQNFFYKLHSALNHICRVAEKNYFQRWISCAKLYFRYKRQKMKECLFLFLDGVKGKVRRKLGSIILICLCMINEFTTFSSHHIHRLITSIQDTMKYNHDIIPVYLIIIFDQVRLLRLSVRSWRFAGK